VIKDYKFIDDDEDGWSEMIEAFLILIHPPTHTHSRPLSTLQTLPYFINVKELLSEMR
jgi:hypothetical protein